MHQPGSFQSILFRSSFSIFVSGLCLLTFNLPAQAESVVIRSEATVIVPTAEDKPLGEFLASLKSRRMALEQAMPRLKQYTAFQHKGLTELDKYAMAKTYLETDLNYYDKNSYWQQKREIRYKTKLEYETLNFPEKFERIYTKDYGDILLNKYVLFESLQLEKRIETYFNRLQSSSNKSFQDLLRQQDGQILLKHEQASKLIEEARELMKLKKFDRAIERFEQANKLTPNSSSLHVLMAFTYLALDDFDQAQKTLSAQIDRTPDDSELYLLRGIFYLAQGIAVKAALEDINMALEKDPENGLAYLIQSLTFTELNRSREAQVSIDMACKVGIESMCGRKADTVKMQIRHDY